MARSRLERRLAVLSERLRVLREELRIASEQLPALLDEAEETRVRALVSDEPGAAKEHREAAKHATALSRQRDRLVARIAEMESEQDALLDRLVAEAS